MLRTLAINSNQSMLSFGVLIAFWSPKQIWDGGEFFGIHARSIPGQGVRIHHRRASGQHIRVGFALGYRHCTRLPPFAPGCLALSTRMFTSGILKPDRKGERFNFSGRTYLDHLIAAYPNGRAAILHSAVVFSWSFLIFATDILGYFALDICCLNPQNLLVTHQL